MVSLRTLNNLSGSARGKQAAMLLQFWHYLAWKVRALAAFHFTRQMMFHFTRQLMKGKRLHKHASTYQKRLLQLPMRLCWGLLPDPAATCMHSSLTSVSHCSYVHVTGVVASLSLSLSLSLSPSLSLSLSLSLSHTYIHTMHFILMLLPQGAGVQEN